MRPNAEVQQGKKRSLHMEMEEEEHTDRKLQLAMLYRKLDKLKKYLSEDDTDNINQVIGSNSPESCLTYLKALEKKHDPHLDCNHLTRLLDFHTRVFASFPLEKHCQNESYARLLVRFAELKAIEDSDEAQDYFIVARSNCKCFAFVHIAHAQFEVSQGNIKKATSILLKAQTLNARPPMLLEVALRNIQAGEKRLVPAEEEQEEEEEEHHTSGVPLQSQGLLSVADCGSSQEGPSFILPAAKLSVDQPRPASKEPLSAWKMPSLSSRHVSPQVWQITPHMPTPALPVPSRITSPMPTPALPIPSRITPSTVCQTPNNKREPYATSFVTPSVRKDPPDVPSSASQRAGAAQPPCTPVNQASYSHTPQSAVLALSNESITIKGKQFFILKMIGRGGSSKVYQVLDHKKQLFAVKYVNLEEADPKTVESYKNEIEHLNHLQQYSDQIIKLYDYEVTDRYIYMLMECGNLDLNTWLRSRKTVVPLERKFYWKNMLEAVQTIHKHGDVWSLGCILYCMTYGRTPFQSITNQFTKLHAIIDPSHKIEFPDIVEQDLLDVLKRCLVRNPRERISIAELLEHKYLQLQPQLSPEPGTHSETCAYVIEQHEACLRVDFKRILTDLAALQSPNSIVRAANNLVKMCSSGRKLDVAECAKSSSQLSWKM
ncbi:unnamed protein product [Merluccius merluccius]